MARPVTKIERMTVDPDVQEAKEREEVIAALMENKEAVLSVITLVDKLQDRGILDLLIALFGQGDKVLSIAARELNKPGVADTLDHLMNAAQMLGKLEINKMKGLVDNVNAGIEEAEKRVESGETTSLFDLMKLLKDPDVNRAVTASVGFLKGAGKGIK
ncbi:uncharacterized protein YjgD (DUF1641 family) [Scopulibacillus darangshiensis]|uniref:Uncharacterized protein YjgD (DUF1641 family) n=1 Tax=Scopulibacillus darangshiensis TaxID=442528 RepID=A0A4R2NQZ7_9BACL|nr:DUF1641 domain-containing protein [Scopulibacillus darangshiensis]TCP23808.1 uncharacterized protein YjgD (DUF1641 family) [Scopulibacillus darangshiensis]